MQYALIGEKLGHSFSKEIHESVFGYDYNLLPLSKDDLPEFFKKRDFKGINVTIPYKQTVIKYLDEIDESAEKIGAVNTVVNKNGKLIGYNTDFLGMRAALLSHGVDVLGKTVLILGTGGTSLTAMAVCEDLGASECLRVSRSEKDGAISYERAKSDYFSADIIINTTPVGMFPNCDECPIDLSDFPFIEAVFDAIYNPLCTKLVVSAKERFINAFGGLYMLVAQAVFAGELFLGEKASEDAISKEYTRILKNKQNIVLVGMPSCGKTTIGKMLAKSFSREFIDIDCEIQKSENQKISDIFAEFGEAHFRDIESREIKKMSSLQGKIISTGGGAVLREENVALLKQNGFLVYIDRPLKLLTPTSDRPLSSDFESLKKRYNERKPIYEAVADAFVLNDGDINDVTQHIREMFLF